MTPQTAGEPQSSFPATAAMAEPLQESGKAGGESGGGEQAGGFHKSIALCAIGLAIFGTLCLPLTATSVSYRQLADLVGAVVPAAAAAAYCHWRGFRKLRECALMVLWACVLSRLLMLPLYAGARLQFPFRDQTF